MYAVETYELTKAYNKFLFWQSQPAVDRLTMNVPTGKVFGFLGPNGAGKTTTLRMLLGLTNPTGGAARILGEDTTNTAIRSRVGYLAETPAYYAYLKAREFLDYYGRIFHMPRLERKKKIAELLDYVGLAEHASSKLKTFSRGMIQRVGLAQAMLNDPDLLLLDEPMTGLDPIGRRQFKDLIRRICQEDGKTVFFCSHVLADAEQICDMVGIISEGRLLVMDSIHKLPRAEGETLEEFFIRIVSESKEKQKKEKSNNDA